MQCAVLLQLLLMWNGKVKNAGQKEGKGKSS